MEDVVTLLGRALDAGLDITSNGETLTVQGPKSAAKLVRQLAEHKHELLTKLYWLPNQLPPELDGVAIPIFDRSATGPQWHGLKREFNLIVVGAEWSGRGPVKIEVKR